MASFLIRPAMLAGVALLCSSVSGYAASYGCKLAFHNHSDADWFISAFRTSGDCVVKSKTFDQTCTVPAGEKAELHFAYLPYGGIKISSKYLTAKVFRFSPTCNLFAEDVANLDIVGNQMITCGKLRGGWFHCGLPNP
jgi:hypothetical protein